MTPNEWIFSGDTGVSSKTIWAVMMGVATEPGQRRVNSLKYDIPYDPADFGRCYRLLALFPEWRKNIGKMGEIFIKWKPMAERWGELERLYEEEYPSGRGPKLYKLMNELEHEGMLLEGWKQTGLGSWQFEGSKQP